MLPIGDWIIGYRRLSVGDCSEAADWRWQRRRFGSL
jgi:hypothetical protein